MSLLRVKLDIFFGVISDENDISWVELIGVQAKQQYAIKILKTNFCKQTKSFCKQTPSLPLFVSFILCYYFTVINAKDFKFNLIEQ